MYIINIVIVRLQTPESTVKIFRREENHFSDEIFSGLDDTWCPRPTMTTTRYTLPKSDQDVVCARESSVPASTKHDTNHCLKTWKEWANYRNANFTVNGS